MDYHSALANWDGSLNLSVSQKQSTYKPSSVRQSPSSANTSRPANYSSHRPGFVRMKPVQHSSDEEDKQYVNAILGYFSSDEGSKYREPSEYKDSLKDWEPPFQSQETVSAMSSQKTASSSYPRPRQSPFGVVPDSQSEISNSVNSLADADGEDDPDYVDLTHDLKSESTHDGDLGSSDPFCGSRPDWLGERLSFVQEVLSGDSRFPLKAHSTPHSSPMTHATRPSNLVRPRKNLAYVLVPPLPPSWFKSHYPSASQVSSPPEPRFPSASRKVIASRSRTSHDGARPRKRIKTADEPLPSPLPTSHAIPLDSDMVDRLFPLTEIAIRGPSELELPSEVAIFAAVRHLCRLRHTVIANVDVTSPATNFHQPEEAFLAKKGRSLDRGPSTQKTASSSTTPDITTDAVDTSTDSRSRLSSPAQDRDYSRVLQTSGSHEGALGSISVHDMAGPIGVSPYTIVNDSYRGKELRHMDDLTFPDQITPYFGLRTLQDPYLSQPQIDMDLIADASHPSSSTINPWLYDAFDNAQNGSQGVLPDVDHSLAFNDGTIDPQLLNLPLFEPPSPESARHRAVSTSQLSEQGFAEDASQSDVGASAQVTKSSPSGSTRPIKSQTKKSTSKSKKLHISQSTRPTHEAVTSDSEGEHDKQEQFDVEYRPTGKSHKALRKTKETYSSTDIHELAAEPTTCHQCRNKTQHEKMRCTNKRPNGELCGLRYCIMCIGKRYEEIEFQPYFTTFICPRCTGTCNCTICSRKRGELYVSTRHKRLTIVFGDAPLSQRFSPRSTRSSESMPPGCVAKGKEKARESWTPTPPPSKSPHDVLWGAVYDVHGKRVGIGYTDNQAQGITVKPAEPLTLPARRKKRRQFVGQPPLKWRTVEPESVGDAFGDQDLSIGVSLRLIVGSKAALSGGYVSMEELDRRRARELHDKEEQIHADNIDRSDPDDILQSDPIANGGTSDQLLFIIAKALAAADPGIS